MSARKKPACNDDELRDRFHAVAPPRGRRLARALPIAGSLRSRFRDRLPPAYSRTYRGSSRGICGNQPQEHQILGNLVGLRSLLAIRRSESRKQRALLNRFIT